MMSNQNQIEHHHDACVAATNGHSTPLKKRYKLKLIYFEDRGKIDLIKLLLDTTGQSYEDVRINPTEFNQYRGLMPFEQLPVLMIDDELKLSQEITICRFIANNAYLTGANDIESIMCDMVVEQLRECTEFKAKLYHELDPARRTQLTSKFLTDILPKTLGGIERLISLNKSKYIVGTRLTWADLALVNVWEWFEEFTRQLFVNYPLIKNHNDFIRSLSKVNEWFKKQKPLRVFKNV